VSDHLVVGSTVTDMLTNTRLPHVDENHTLRLNLQPHEGLSLLVTPDGRTTTDSAATDTLQEHRRLQP